MICPHCRTTSWAGVHLVKMEPGRWKCLRCGYEEKRPRAERRADPRARSSGRAG